MNSHSQGTRPCLRPGGIDRRTVLKASAGATAMLVMQSAFDIEALAQDDPLSTGFQFLNPPQVATVEAIAERIWPATDESPGARDAGVVYYIDRALAGEYEQYQLDYRIGLQALDALSRERHDAPFRDLTAEQQHALLERIEAGEQEQIEQAQEQQGEEEPAPSTEQGQEGAARSTQRGQEGGAPSGSRSQQPLASQVGVIERQIAGLTPSKDADLSAFFDLIHAHTMEGLFSDPIHGGNRDFAGWRAVGYPGAYYVYTEEEQQSFEPLEKPFQSIADL